MCIIIMGNILKTSHKQLLINFSQSELVNLQNKQLGDEGMKHFVHLKSEVTFEIYLNGNSISSIGIENLFAVRPQWMKLKQLRLYENQIGNIGCKLLTKLRTPALVYISLGKNQIGDQGVLHLSKSRWKNLQKMSLHENNLAINSIRYLIKSDWQICALFFQYNKLTLNELILIVLSTWKKLQMMPVYQNNLCFLFDRRKIYRIEAFTGREITVCI